MALVSTSLNGEAGKRSVGKFSVSQTLFVEALRSGRPEAGSSAISHVHVAFKHLLSVLNKCEVTGAVSGSEPGNKGRRYIKQFVHE